jgi:hypothetical protein
MLIEKTIMNLSVICNASNVDTSHVPVKRKNGMLYAYCQNLKGLLKITVRF